MTHAASEARVTAPQARGSRTGGAHKDVFHHQAQGYKNSYIYIHTAASGRRDTAGQFMELKVMSSVRV